MNFIGKVQPFQIWKWLEIFLADQNLNEQNAVTICLEIRILVRLYQGFVTFSISWQNLSDSSINGKWAEL